MEIVDGKKIAQEIISELKTRLKPRKKLVFISVGTEPASLNFLKQKKKTAQELNIDFRHEQFPETVNNDFLRKEIGKIAALKKTGGVILQLPLPSHLNKHCGLNTVPLAKDIDVLGERALGAFYNQRGPVLPPAVGALAEILKFKNCELKNKKVAVVGLGFLVGKPISVWLINQTKDLFLLDKNSDFSILGQADLIITGAGQPGLIKPTMLKADAGLIDFGCSFDETSEKIRGDFDSASISNSGENKNAGWYTPTPGGTGPIVTAKLFENFYDLAEDR